MDAIGAVHDVGHALEWCAIVTVIIVGYNAFTQYFFNMTSWDAAFHQDWMHNATIFGRRCDVDTFFDWLRIFVLVDQPVTQSEPLLFYGNDSHTALTICCLSGWLVAALLAFILSLTPMRKRVLGLFYASSLALTLSGILLGVAWFGDYSSSSFISQCLFSMFAKFFNGFGISAAWCFGVPLLYGYTRPEVHEHAEHLLGSLAIAIVTGELLGFLTASFAREGSWIMITASFTATASLPLPLPQARKQLEEYTFPGGLRDDVPENKLDFLATKRFYLHTFRAGVLWSTVDLTRSIGMQLVVNALLSFFIHTLHLKLWCVFTFQTALKVVFVGVAWGLRHSGGQHDPHAAQHDADVNQPPPAHDGAGGDREHAA